MVDIIAMRKLYDTREIDEICSINRADNSADSTTKSNPEKGIVEFVDHNGIEGRLEVRPERSVKEACGNIREST